MHVQYQEMYTQHKNFGAFVPFYLKNHHTYHKMFHFYLQSLFKYFFLLMNI